ncbi:hypothetical protein BASA61_003461 [Batrachochytrium salamandrivorans]|nr:hypothetical protein BASA61_003461 [Batrachochytrium salamandrivorans]
MPTILSGPRQEYGKVHAVKPAVNSINTIDSMQDKASLQAQLDKADKREALLQTLPNKILEESSLTAVPFLSQDATHSAAWLETSAWLFRMAKSFEPFETTPLPELYTNGFDLEQIWEQIKLLNEPLIPYISEMAAEFPNMESAFEEDSDVDDDQSLEDDQDGDSTSFERGSDDDEESEFASDDDQLDLDGSGQDIDPEDEDESELNRDSSKEDEYEMEMEMPFEDNGKKPTSHPKRKRSVVDDDFFSLEDMEKFADLGEQHDIKAARRASENKNKDNDDSSDSNEDEDTMFSFDADMLNGDLMSDNEMTGDTDNANDIRYEDFFGDDEAKSTEGNVKKQRPRPSWQERSGEQSHMHEKDRNKSDDEEMSTTEEPSTLFKSAHKQNLFEEDAAPIAEADDQVLSTFEKQQARLQKTIEQLETEAMQTKPWAMKGEVSTKARPKNSLLEEDLEIEHAAKPVPVITEETTVTLETLITQRIKDQVWDDVVRKTPPKDTVYDPNRRFELIDEKSSKSLAQVYEDEYLRQANKQAPTEKDLLLAKKHEEVTLLFSTLCQDLDALSNWHYTPKAATLEVEVLPAATVPAIQMEEVTPAGVSDAMLAAPKEVYQGTVAKSQLEMDSADKRKARLKAKRKAQQEHKMRENARKEREAATGVSSAQVTKEKAMKQLMGQSNVTIVGDRTSKQQMDRVSSKGKGGKTKLGKQDMQATVVQEGGKVGQTKGRTERSSNLRL